MYRYTHTRLHPHMLTLAHIFFITTHAGTFTHRYQSVRKPVKVPISFVKVLEQVYEGFLGFEYYYFTLFYLPATTVQAKYRGYHQRKQYLRMKVSGEFILSLYFIIVRGIVIF
jgi:hypothetical protein